VVEGEEELGREGHPHTPLNAIVSGPVAGGPFESDWFDVVCPEDERRYLEISIDARGAKTTVVQQASEFGIYILTHWRTVLRDALERCLEIIAEGDAFPQIFDRLLWKISRILTLWDSVSQSPLSRLLDASPIVGPAVARSSYLFLPRVPHPTHPARRDVFQRMITVHLRRGDDYEAHCRGMSRGNETRAVTAGISSRSCPIVVCPSPARQGRTSGSSPAASTIKQLSQGR
jgi:hypothetical protein